MSQNYAIKYFSSLLNQRYLRNLRETFYKTVQISFFNDLFLIIDLTIYNLAAK